MAATDSVIPVNLIKNEVRRLGCDLELKDILLEVIRQLNLKISVDIKNRKPITLT